MKILFDGEPETLIVLAMNADSGLCILKRSYTPSKELLKMGSWENGSNTHINLYNDYIELAYFIGNLHLCQSVPKNIFIDLNIVKKKEILQTVALILSIQQFCSSQVYCVLGSYSSTVDMWNIYCRYFTHIFIVNSKVLSVFSYDSGKLSIKAIGDLVSNINVILCS
jgi:hypothetical protein